MKTLFFYGTMRHLPLLECVLGRGSEHLDHAEGVLPEHTVLAAQDGPFPVLIKSDGDGVHGLKVMGLTEQDIARLNFYEAGFDYDIKDCALADGSRAVVYMPTPDVRATDTPWDFDAWAQQWAAMSVAAAEEVMDGFGTLSPEVIAARFPQIRKRAWSRVLAQSGRHGAGVLNGSVDVIKRWRAYTGFFGFDELRLQHETFDGEMSDVLDRSVFISSDAALVLPYDPVRDRVLLVEQVRMGPIGRHDPVAWQMEPVAGLIDPGEMPRETARREAREEAGLELQHLEDVGGYYASPGATTEYFYMFVGLCDLPNTEPRIGGEADEGENIRAHVMPFQSLLDMAEDGRTGNVPLTLLAYWLARHRDRLRAHAAG
ncbi:NUDIX domain-containing protein [Tateyamaria sp.]|uniref:NUDIX domain-containing protein n=1 Tax=Tateyamaria sp. TaxID=1929288 RepID=UPI0032A05778